MKIASVAAVLPSRQITNDWIIDEIVKRSREQLSKIKLKIIETLLTQAFKKSGTRVRYVRDEGERAVDLAVKAGRAALDQAGLEPEDVELLIYTGVGRGWLEPDP